MRGVIYPRRIRSAHAENKAHQQTRKQERHASSTCIRRYGDPRHRMIGLLDQQLDLTHPTNVGPGHNLLPPRVGRKTMQRLHPIAPVARHGQTARLAEDVEREHGTRGKDVAFGDAALIVERVGVAHALIYQDVFVEGRDPRFGFEVLVECPYHLDVVCGVLDELGRERTS